MPVTFHGVSEYDRNYRWVDGPLAATCAAPMAGMSSGAMGPKQEPPLQRKSRAASPLRDSVLLQHPSSFDRRSVTQDEYLLLGRNDKFENSLPYRNSLKASREAWSSEQHENRNWKENSNGDGKDNKKWIIERKDKKRERVKRRSDQEMNFRRFEHEGRRRKEWYGGKRSNDSYEAPTPDAPRSRGHRSCATQTSNRAPLPPPPPSPPPPPPPSAPSRSLYIPRARRQQFATTYSMDFGDRRRTQSANADAAIVEANRLRNRGTHFSRRHFGQLLGNGTGTWMPTPDTPTMPLRRPKTAHELEQEEAEAFRAQREAERKADEEAEELRRSRSFSPIRVPHDVAGRLPTPRAVPFRRHHLDRTTPAVGGSILTAPASARTAERTPRDRRRTTTLDDRVAGRPSEDAFELLDETVNKERAVRFAADRTRVIGRESPTMSSSSSSSSSRDSDDSGTIMTSSRSSRQHFNGNVDPGVRARRQNLH